MKLKERAAIYGLETLTIFEKISVLTNIDIDILNKFSSLHELKKSLDDLEITKTKKLKLQSIFDIVKTYSNEKFEIRTSVNSPGKVYDYLKYDLENLDYEVFIIITLDSKMKVINKNILTVGILNASLAHPREIFTYAVKDKSNSFILVHNHPSGDPTPSPQDISLTRRVKQASEIMGIDLTDHIIIGKNRYISLKEEGHI